MAILTINDLSVTFVERTLFSNVNFDIEEKDKVGLVGANGVGKTTIFKIIAGELEPTVGNVFRSKISTVGYMKQHSVCSKGRSVYNELLSVFDNFKEIEKLLEDIAIQIENGAENIDALIKKQLMLQEKYEEDGGLTYKSRTRSTLLGLGFSESDFLLKTENLSGGQLSKLSLAKLLLSGANILLLDEPTNHLDIESISWLESFIKDFNGAVLVVSHDRYFLDSITNKTVELMFNKTTCYTGNYSEFLKKKKQVTEAVNNQYEKDIKEIKRIEGIVEQQKRWGQTRNYITAASKQKQADKLKETLTAPDGKIQKIHFDFTPKRVSGSDVLICENLKKSFKTKTLFKNLNIHIKSGERVFILGSNGCGKTTLFKILMNKLSYESGNIKLGSSVDIGYFDQVQADLTLSNSALDEVWNEFSTLTETKVRTALGSFLIKGDDVFKPLQTLSGGERARISLLKLMLKGPNFLLLDEPTNHLDTNSREQLEKTLLDYKGTMLIVSHDRYFINKMATRILVMTPTGMEEYLGNYDYFLEKSKEKAANFWGNIPSKKPTKTNSYKEKKEQESNKRKVKTALERQIEKIETTDKQIVLFEKYMQTTEVTADYEKLIDTTTKLEMLNAEQEKNYILWEQLQKQADDMEIDDI